MIVRERATENRLSWFVTSDDDDRRAREGQRAELAREEVSFDLPGSWDPDELHPDAHALAVLLTLRPFIGASLTVPRGVSGDFARTVQEELGVRVTPVDGALASRTVRDGRVGLAFSGGVDSVASLSVLPPDTVSVFLDRERPEGVEASTKYRPEAARHACAELARRGREVYSIPTDLEFLRNPVGFPVFDRSSVESNGVGLVLLADMLGLDAVAWGTVAEVSYGTGFGGFVDHAQNAEHRSWRRVLSAAGLDVVSPLIGVSEVGALRLVQDSALQDIAQSCVRGDVGQPCLNCWKCVRKALGVSSLSGTWPDTEELARLLLVREFRRQLRSSPAPLGAVLGYALARAPECGELTWLLRLRLGVTGPKYGAYLERWYSPAAAMWSDRYREVLSAELDRRLGRMNEDEEAMFRRWAPDAREERPQVAAFALATVRYLDALAGESTLAEELTPLYRPFREVVGRVDDNAATALRTEEAALVQELEALRTSGRYRRGNMVVRAMNRARLK